MKYLSEFRDSRVAEKIVRAIHATAGASKHYRIMEFCGGHTHAIFKHGISDILPANVEYVHGPGCPVCILPSARIAAVRELILSNDITLCTYGDVLRVPCAKGESLQSARAEGADVRVVYSPLDCLSIAQAQNRPVIFFAVGFETTAPATAALLVQARQKALENIFVYSNHVVTPAALVALLNPDDSQERCFDAMLGPAHVSTITGAKIYRTFTEEYQVPIVVSGFEPLDILQSTLMAIRQINVGEAQVENEYTRAVSEQGNAKAQQLMQQTFKLRTQFEWRGLGVLPDSALQVSDAYAAFDAEQAFDFKPVKSADNKACQCPAVLRGEIRPQQCKLFANGCSPDNPMGACMVSSEGACAAQWQYQTTQVNHYDVQ